MVIQRLLFRGEKLSTTDILHTFLAEHNDIWSITIFGRIRGLTNRYIFPEFRELWSGGPVIPCGDMHQSFTDTLVRGFSTTSICLPIALVLFLYSLRTVRCPRIRCKPSVQVSRIARWFPATARPSCYKSKSEYSLYEQSQADKR